MAFEMIDLHDRDAVFCVSCPGVLATMRGNIVVIVCNNGVITMMMMM